MNAAIPKRLGVLEKGRHMRRTLTEARRERCMSADDMAAGIEALTLMEPEAFKSHPVMKSVLRRFRATYDEFLKREDVRENVCRLFGPYLYGEIEKKGLES